MLNISLSPDETRVVDQFVRYLNGTPEGVTVSKAFLLVFAVAYTRQVKEDGEAHGHAANEELAISEDDVLTLLELVPSTTMLGPRYIGAAIHRKLYEALLRFHPEQAVEMPQEADATGMSEEQTQKRFKALKRKTRRGLQ